MSRNMCHSNDGLFYQEELRLNRIKGQMSESAEFSQLRDNFPESLKPAFKLPQYQKFLKRHLPLLSGKEKSFESLALITSYAILKRLNDSLAFQMFMTDDRSVSEIRDQTEEATPFEAGLRLIFSEELKKFQVSLVSYIESNWFSTRHNETLVEDDSQRISKSPFDATHTQLLFAPSGSGKTAYIFAELKRNYGYYIVSSAIGKGGDAHSSGLDGNIFDPKVLKGVSRDTRELFDLLHCISPLSFGYRVTRWILVTFWNRIVEARCRVFRAFRKAGKLRSSPESWLSFQLNCDEWDPFSYIFRALSLFHVDTKNADSIEFLYAGDLSEDNVVQWVCLDEAQEDLRYHIVDDDYNNMLDIAMLGLFFPNFCRQAICAGTSLNLRKAIASRRLLDQVFFDSEVAKPYRKWSSVLDFPLVMDKSDLESTLRDCGLKSQKVLDTAAEHGSALFGRIKWTAMYAESILTELKKQKLSDEDTHTDDEYNALNLRNLADETYKTIITHLIDKLRIIEERGDGSKLLDQLLKAAISTDIRGLPHVFQHDSDMKLVDQDFAMVGTKIDQISIKLKRYFTIVTKKTNLLKARLRNHDDVEEGTIYLLSQAAHSKFSISGYTINAITPEVATNGFTIVDCKSIKMKSDKTKQAYNQNGRATRHSKLENDLSRWNLRIEVKTDNSLFAKLKEGVTLNTKTADEVNSFLEEHSYININIPIADLSMLVHNGFRIEQSTLVGELKERVVIDAILRFFDNKLNDKLINYIKGLSTRTGLGHPSEYFLTIVSIPHFSAVECELRKSWILRSFLFKSQQLRQFFTSSSNSGGRLHEKWKERRQRAKARLAQAENGSGSPSSQITDLQESTLVSGDRTVVKFDSLKDWVTGFLEWLTAIENGFKPCASFLFPHNDFGPDLIFALRTETGDIILCSIQVSRACRRSSSLWAKEKSCNKLWSTPFGFLQASMIR